MPLLIRKLYCKGCQKAEKHIIYIDKADVNGYTFTLTCICLSIYCNSVRKMTISSVALAELIKRDAEDNPDSECGI
jgi:hypothetical protein